MKRVYQLLFAAALACVFAVPFTGTAHAASGACFYYPDSGNHAALNAWGGGPFVNVYHSCAAPNDDFTLLFVNNDIQLEFTGGGPWNGYCIGDAYDKTGNAYTSLDPCSPAGWGTLFQEQTAGCGQGQLAFWDVHWGGYLGPPNPYGDGSHFYLNNYDYFCFSIG